MNKNDFPVPNKIGAGIFLVVNSNPSVYNGLYQGITIILILNVMYVLNDKEEQRWNKNSLSVNIVAIL